MAESPGTQDEGTGARRGRRPVRPDPASGPVALLAHRLWELKEQAGDPSFADMASRLGAAASKSSLAAAARGSALPSWETTWEFVRVLAVDRLGRDPGEVRREWRAYWEEAADPKDETPMPHTPDPGPDGGQRLPHGENRTPTPRRRTPSRRRPALLAAAVIVAGAAAVLAGWILPPLTDRPESTPAPSPAPTTASPHDDSVFEGDVTYPDGTVVRAGTTFDKTWRLRNAGNVPWQDRYLTRMNDTPCKAPKRVGIGPVLPGEPVDITVRVRASDSPGRCKIFWKMTDEDGTPLLASKRPIFLDVTVA